MTRAIDSLNQMSLSAMRQFFSSLEAPEPGSLRGLFRGMFVGPDWLRRGGGPALAITGLGGWWGKEFAPDGNGINLVIRAGEYKKVFPMYIVKQPSFLDRRDGLALRYRRENPFPWPWIVDELRRVDANLVLGMTLVDRGPLKRLAIPFILQSREALD